MQAVLGSLSSSVIGRPDVFNLMKQEPANSLLEATYLLQLGQKVTADGPLDAEGLEVEMEMNNLLLSLRPIKQVCCAVYPRDFLMARVLDRYPKKSSKIVCHP
jgi:exocyst complex component 4